MTRFNVTYSEFYLLFEISYSALSKTAGSQQGRHADLFFNYGLSKFLNLVFQRTCYQNCCGIHIQWLTSTAERYHCDNVSSTGPVNETSLFELADESLNVLACASPLLASSISFPVISFCKHFSKTKDNTHATSLCLAALAGCQ